MLRRMEHLETFSAVNIYAFPPAVDTFEFNTQLKSLSFAETDLSNLNPEVFRPIEKLLSLDLSKSKMRSLDFLVRANLSALRYLKLSNNELTVINETVFHSLPSLTYLDLSNNPFTCECSNAGFIQWAKNNKQTQVTNTHLYICYFPVDKRGSLLLDFDIHSCWDDGNFFYFISSTSLVVLTILTSFIYHFLRWHLTYTFHLFLAFLYDNRKRKRGDDHQFDAFVSYNVRDEDWVYREMLPVLEGEQGWRLCLHHRDFQPGKPIIENITDAIYGSRKTICVISHHYLQSEWCSREIQMASFRLFDEQKDVLILLFLKEISSHHLSPYYRMRKLVKKRTYLSWPQAVEHPGVFWQNVQRALQTGDALTENTDLLTGPGGS
ncbi:toll-like receptor 13 [Anableps anableps]